VVVAWDTRLTVAGGDLSARCHAASSVPAAIGRTDRLNLTVRPWRAAASSDLGDPFGYLGDWLAPEQVGVRVLGAHPDGCCGPSNEPRDSETSLVPTMPMISIDMSTPSWLLRAMMTTASSAPGFSSRCGTYGGTKM
jgi:hypothetical protein